MKPKEAATLIENPDNHVKVISSTFYMPGDPRKKDQVYKDKRVPKARFMDIDEVADKKTELPHMLPSLEEFEQHMDKIRVKGNDKLVIYDDESILGAARAWWTFQVFGVKASVMEGGFPKWQKDVGKTEEGEVSWKKGSHESHSAGTFKFHKELVKDMKDIRAWVENPWKDFQLVDARAPARFKGTEPDPRGLRTGHIPGSKNVWFKLLLNDDNTFKSDEEIKAIFHKNGIDITKPITTTCGSGVTASVLFLALKKIGAHDVSLYDGSWSEWGRYAENPVATITP
eukprot:CAMPEP_0176425912 /NCGR_PEP_ID=MMETSP0127-20121128/11648_1 /TAXON_ID=938130 /ORGANISM="Platyophrya macrostoma, Strain WH" /LENGTH=284 /DNA_ID=CAMNT_0017807117 /DNA_START=106 /DNA_END=960 /DNA_ORIENTATION=+